jgi:hypothetical protein
MIAVRVMQMARDAVIDVVAMRHRLVTAAGAMHMTCLVAGAAVLGGAAVGVLAGDFDHVLVDMPFMRVVQVTVVQIIDMPVMPDRLMAAARPMLVGMLGMLFVGAGRHRC